MQNVWYMALSALISAIISTFVGVAVRAAIERKLQTAAATAEENKKRRVRFTATRSAWQRAATRLFYHLVRIAQEKERANGELERAYRELECADSCRAEMERTYAAEAQED